MRPFIPVVVPPDLAALTSTPNSCTAGGYRHLLDDDLPLRSPPYLDTVISPSNGTISPPTTTSPDLGILNIFPTEVIIPILNHCDIRSLLYFRLVNRHALSLVDFCPGYLPIRQHAPNVLRGILALETGKYWTLPQLWKKLCQNTCDAPSSACYTRGTFAGYLCLLKRKRYCWNCWNSILMSDWGHPDKFHGWPGPMSVEFASHFFGLDRGLLERVEPQFKAVPRATVPEEVIRGISNTRFRSKLEYTSGPRSGTWPGHKGLKEGERLVMLDTETVFALALYMGLDPNKQANISWRMAAELMYCWRWYVNQDPEGFLEKGRKAAVKAGVDLSTIASIVTEPGYLKNWKKETIWADGTTTVSWSYPSNFEPWWRFLSVMRVPWFDDGRMEVQWGFCGGVKGLEFTVEQFRRYLMENS